MGLYTYFKPLIAERGVTVYIYFHIIIYISSLLISMLIFQAFKQQQLHYFIRECIWSNQTLEKNVSINFNFLCQLTWLERPCELISSQVIRSWHLMSFVFWCLAWTLYIFYSFEKARLIELIFWVEVCYHVEGWASGLLETSNLEYFNMTIR